MSKLTRQETETIIRRSESDGYFDIYSDIPRDIRRILQAAEAFGCEVHKTEYGGVRCRLPLKALTFRAKKGHPGNPNAFKRGDRDEASDEPSQDR